MNTKMTLNECPPGLFWFNGELGFKSEYGRNNGQCDAYCVSSGEYFWGGASGDVQKRGNLIVEPLDCDQFQPQPEAVVIGDVSQRAVEILAEFQRYTHEVGPCPIGITGPWSNKLAALCHRIAHLEKSAAPQSSTAKGEAQVRAIIEVIEPIVDLAKLDALGGQLSYVAERILDRLAATPLPGSEGTTRDTERMDWMASQSRIDYCTSYWKKTDTRTLRQAIDDAMNWCAHQARQQEERKS